MNTVTKTLGAGALLTALAVAPASAQYADDHWEGRDRSPRVTLGGAFVVANPVGEFGTVVDAGFGVTGHVRVAADPAGVVSLRLDGGVVRYGHERVPVCFEGVGCRVVADLVTNNDIAFVDIGPELGVQMGALRPYAGVSAGLSYFHTSSSLRDAYYDGYDDAFTTVNFDDAVFAWRARAGMQVRLTHGRSPLSLDLGAVYHHNGQAEYLTEGDVVDNPDGSITLFPVFSDADLVTFQVGLAVGLGGGRDHHHDRRRRRGRRH